MVISSQIFEAYLQCQTKCWLKSHMEDGDGNLYAEWIKNRTDLYRAVATKHIMDELQPSECVLSPPSINPKTASWLLATEYLVNNQEIQSCIHAIERVQSKNQGTQPQFMPIRFIANNKLSKLDKSLVAFDSFILSESLKRKIIIGKIIHGDDFWTSKVKIALLTGQIKKNIEKIFKLITADSPPELILNRDCSECEYQHRCREKAIEKDDLSLLGGMTKKERNKLNNKGIFTVKQLSYTFRPRRRPKRRQDKIEKYYHSLKALAIREDKIHIVGKLDLKIEGNPVYLDVEGLPDSDFYYLIGARIRQGDSIVQHSLWADCINDEKNIWKKFLEILESIEKPILICYGSYETIFIKTMIERYNTRNKGSIALLDKLSQTVNLLSVIYGHIYFPVLSNGLKDIANSLGFRWSEDKISGLQSIVWRKTWEATNDQLIKEKLKLYNFQDCEALEIVTQKVLNLCFHQENLNSNINEIVDVNNLKRDSPHGFKRNIFVINDFGFINKAAYWDYQRERVYLKTNSHLRQLKRASKSNKVYRPDKIIDCPPAKSCLFCFSKKICLHGRKIKKVIDLKFTRHGIKRWIIQYRFNRYFCNNCKRTFYTNDRPWDKGKYGVGLISYALYQCIDLHVPLMTLDVSLSKLFKLNLASSSTNGMKKVAAVFYEKTYNAIIDKLCNSKLLHADETKISVNGKDGFVWILASLEEVAYFYTPTREGEFIQSLLNNFKGVLVSDFYAAYDSINCPQQKCLIHLIRDINDSLFSHPYDEELKLLAQSFSNLLRPIIETIDRFGLKHYFLKKYLPFVNKFYRNLSQMHLTTEPAKKIKDRFEKNKGKLFTFLDYDGVPWNNNNAEHAIKPFAILRHIIKGVTSEKGLREYLILLSICETCKYKGLEFLDFLKSGEKDIDMFAANQRTHRIK
jgi:predicted RecB family nuclease